MQLTEICDTDAPHLIVNVETTPATTPDDNMIGQIHESLERRDLLPAKHVVDKGYTDSKMLVESEQKYDVTIIGPVADDPSWQARSENGFAKADFEVDWEKQIVRCPAGKHSTSWWFNKNPKNGMVWEARFSGRDCSSCRSRSQCTRSKTEPRVIGMQSREQFEALQKARRQQKTVEFRREYAVRAGIEATHAQGIKRCGMRHSRYVGEAKMHLQQVLTATAINIVRVGEWMSGRERAKTRCSRFAGLRKECVKAS